MKNEKLIMLPVHEYVGVDHDDPIRQYTHPIFGNLYKKRIETCLSECVHGDKILEVGYGTGVTFFNLAKKYNQIYGIDLKSNSKEITELFSSKGLQVDLRQGDLLKLPFSDNMFDTVLLISILEHIKPEYLTLAFSELHRVLKKGGQLVYGVPVDSIFTRIGFLLLGYNIRKHHFSNENQIFDTAKALFKLNTRISLRSIFSLKAYDIGNFVKE